MASTVTNVSTFQQAQAAAQYERDGVQIARHDLRRTALAFEKGTDTLTRLVSSTIQNGTGAATVLLTAAMRLYSVTIVPSGSAGTLLLYDLTAATVTSTAAATATYKYALSFAANESITYNLIPGNSPTGNASGFTTGLCAGYVTLTPGTTACGTTVSKVEFIYAT